MDKIHIATELAFKNGYEKGYEAGKKFATDNKVGDKWIPVTERLPEEYAMVLIYDGDSVEPSLFLGDRGFYEADKYEANPFCGVTHWMPLPEPPKEV